MAAIEISGNQVAGIKYTWRTDDKTDWTSVPIDTYFFHTQNEVVYFKDSVGQIWDIYVNFKQYINYFEFNGSVTTIDTVDTWVKLNTVSTTSLFASGADLVHTNNRVTYIGTIPRVFKIEGIVSVSSGNNDEIHAAFFRDGTLYPCSEQSVVSSSGGKSGALPFQCVIELQENEYVEVWVKNKTSTSNITLININVIISEM